MRRFAVLTTLLAVALLAAALSASPASATVLCKTATDPCTGGVYPKGTTIEASTNSHSVLDSLIGKIECKSSIKGEVTGAGGEGTDVTGTITSWGISGCTTAVVQVLKNGAFTINSPSEGGGTLVLEGFETTVETFGLHCVFSGPVSIPLKGGEMASISPGSTVTRTGGRSGAWCGSSAPWTVDYTVTAPEPLWVAEKAFTSSVLCKTATDPCTGGVYPKGTTIEASTSGHSVLDSLIGKIECKSSIKGEVTGAGGEGTDVTGTITSWGISGCTTAVVQVLKNGAFTIKATEGGNGTLVLEGFETTVETSGLHCVFSGPVSIPLKGGEMASIAISATMPRTGGRSGPFCGSSAPWTGNYTVTAPEPLWVAEKAFTSSVLCKTATDPCTGGVYPKGTTIEASTSGHSVLDSLIGKIECKSSIKGEVTGAGGEGTDVTGTITSWGISGCTTAVVQVLKNGAFTIKSPKEGGGTLVLEGFETTVETSGLHCVFSGPVSIPLKGGEMASIAISATMPRTGGRSGPFCGSSAPWTGNYTVTAPEPLWVAET